MSGTRGPYKAWTNRDIETARQLWAGGANILFIAQDLGRTFDSVRAKIHQNREVFPARPRHPSQTPKKELDVTEFDVADLRHKTLLADPPKRPIYDILKSAKSCRNSAQIHSAQARKARRYGRMTEAIFYEDAAQKALDEAVLIEGRA